MQQLNQKVLIIGPAHPYRGGIADTNEAMCRAFSAAGWDAQLITFSVQYPNFLFPGKTQFSQDLAPSELKILRWIHSMNPFNWIAAARKINRLKPDVVIIRYWLPLMAPAFGAIAWLLQKSIRVIGLTDNVIPHEKRMMDSLFTKYFMSNCDGFMALSASVEKDLKSLTSKPCSYFPHPINDQLGERVAKEEARKKLGLDLNAKYLLFFGFVRKYKGLDLLLHAMASPVLADSEIKLIIAGEFYDDPAEYEKIISDAGLGDRIVLRNDFIPTAEVGSYFCAADLVTQTYRSATQSGITQMALHFEVPVLVTRVGGLDEFVVENRTGLFADPDPSSIANGIFKFFELDPKTLAEAIKIEKKRVSWQAFVAHFQLFVNQKYPK